jgi:hypothetical protein
VDKIGICLVDQNSNNDHLNSVRAFGPGLQQAQINLPTSFTVDAHSALNSNENIKVVVTSKIHF